MMKGGDRTRTPSQGLLARMLKDALAAGPKMRARGKGSGGEKTQDSELGAGATLQASVPNGPGEQENPEPEND